MTAGSRSPSGRDPFGGRTAPVGYRFRHWLRLQLEAIFRRTDKPFFPDLDDDLFLLTYHAEI